MAIDKTTAAPVRHVASLYASTNWNVPIGTNAVFVSVHGATGGSGGGSNGGGGGPGGTSSIGSGWVQVSGGSNAQVIIGAGGTGGNFTPQGHGPSGSLGGITSFDGAILTPSSPGGIASPRYGGGSTGASASPATANTALTTVNPGNSTIARVTSFTSQNSGGTAGNAGPSGTGGSTGNAGFMHVYA